MYLYKYCPLVFAKDLARIIDVVETKRLYAPQVGQLNDPMEGSAVNAYPLNGYAGISISHANGKTAGATRQIFDTTRIISLSELCTSPQMWALYASKYEGACLQFQDELLPFETFRVMYSDEHIGNRELIDIPDFTREHIVESLKVKDRSWSFEKEWRSILDDASIDDQGYCDIGRDNPSAVIVGHRCDKSAIQAIAAVCRKSNTPLYTTYIADRNRKVMVVPHGFEVMGDGRSIQEQIAENCVIRGMQDPGAWE